MSTQEWGALLFGVVMGWQLYMINRYRSGHGLQDLVSIVGAIGGAAILDLFPAGTDLFALYGIGLAVGFFLYFLVLLLMVSMTKAFGVEWFLDGRRTKPTDNEVIPEGTATTVAPMSTPSQPKLPG